MNLPLNKRCAEMLTSVSAIFMLFWLPLKKQPLLWRGERCVKKSPVYEDVKLCGNN